MPLIQGGPPEWVWERSGDEIRCTVVHVPAPGGGTAYELRFACGLELLRVHFLTATEARAVAAAIAAGLAS